MVDLLYEVHLTNAPVLPGGLSRLFEKGNNRITEFKKLQIIDTSSTIYLSSGFTI